MTKGDDQVWAAGMLDRRDKTRDMENFMGAVNGSPRYDIENVAATVDAALKPKVEIYVDLDECFVFYPVYKGSPNYHDWMMHKPFKLEVDQALIDEYEAASAAFSAVREKLEQLYRVQHGLTPWASSTVPEHKVLP